MRLAPPLHRSVHAAVLAATFAALMALVPAPARASGGGLSLGAGGDDAALALLAINASVFGVIDIVFIASDRPMPMWLSFLQIGIAGAAFPFLAVSSARSVGPKVAAGMSAVIFTGYAIYDIARYPEYRRQKLRERELERLREGCGIAIEPRAEGALLHVYGRL